MKYNPYLSGKLLHMTQEERYHQFMVDHLENDLKSYELYYSELLESWWWINPTTKEWKLEFEESGTLWWSYNWGTSFMSLTGSDEPEFVDLIKEYVTNIITNVKLTQTAKLDTQPEGDVEKILESRLYG